MVKQSLLIFSALTIGVFFLVNCSTSKEEVAKNDQASDSEILVANCFLENDGSFIHQSLNPDYQFALTDTLHALHNRNELNLQNLLQTDLELIKQLAPPFVNGVTLMAISENAPELMDEFCTDQGSAPIEPEKRKNYIVSAIKTFASAGIELLEFTPKEMPEIQMEEVIIPKNGNEELH